MAVRKIYVEPGELVEVRICREGTDKNAKDWMFQPHPQSMLLTFGANSVETCDPQVRFVLTAPSGKIRKYYQ